MDMMAITLDMAMFLSRGGDCVQGIWPSGTCNGSRLASSRGTENYGKRHPGRTGAWLWWRTSEGPPCPLAPTLRPAVGRQWTALPLDGAIPVTKVPPLIVLGTSCALLLCAWSHEPYHWAIR